VPGLHKAVEPFSGAADRARQQHNARSASSWRRSRWQAGQPCPSITPADCGHRPTHVTTSRANVACYATRDLGISDQSVYTWRRQDRIDRGVVPGLSSAEKGELAAAKRRIAELETELRAMCRAIEPVREVVPPKGGSRRSR
jgi:transposase